ncbi:MAG: glycosyltransferase, partial [Ilumatobacteraceae bacterium]
MPARKAAATIGDTFRSLAGQTCRSWEAVVVDDGSTDATPQIIARWVADDPRFRVVAGPRLGVSAARNAGIGAVHHDWVAFLDADDRIHPSYVARMTDAVMKTPQTDGARCRWAYETEGGRFSTAVDWDLDRGVDPFEVFAGGCSFAIHACVVRRTRLIDCGGFDTELVVGEDWDLWQRLAREGLSLVVVPETLAFYVMRPQSAMHRDVDGVLRDMLACYRRGHSNDVRVGSPLPEYVDGAALVPGRDIVGENVLACAAVVTGMGGDPWPLPRRPPDPGLTLMPEFAADIVFDSVPFGACLLPADWPAIWTERSGEIAALIDDVASWCDQPQIVRRTRRLLEKRIVLEDTATTGSLVVGATVGISIDLAAPIRDIEVPPATERLVVKARFGDRWLGSVDVPVLGDGSSPARVEAQWIRDAVERELGLRLLKAVMRSPRSMVRVARAAGPGSLRRVGRFLLDLPLQRVGGRRYLVRSFARSTASELIAEAAVLGERHALAPAAEDRARDVETGSVQQPLSDEYGKEYFEEVFEQDDPWFYTSGYEQTKYEQTLSLIDGVVGRALELACAEGHFSVQLAPLVGHLVATDISERALQRAAKRCGYAPHIEFTQIDLRGGALPSELDLIVCSEVLYYLPEEEDLRALGRRFADALVAGGQAVMAHANLVSDEPGSTGFDWGHKFGSRRIGELVSSVQELYLETEIVTPLYRIQSIRKLRAPAQTPPPPTYRFLPHAQDLDPYISRMVIWGGAVMTQDVAMDSERTIHLPILMYHRVAESGPPALAPYRISPQKLEEQLAHLRRHGYYGVTVSRWQESLAERRPLPG